MAARREHALGLLRRRADEAREEARRRSFGVARNRDSSELVRILLWEDELESAWRQAESGGCREELCFELAPGARRPTRRTRSVPMRSDRAGDRSQDQAPDRADIDARALRRWFG